MSHPEADGRHAALERGPRNGAQPALVLLLSDPPAGATARGFLDVLRTRLGHGAACHVLALDELRQEGLDSAPNQLLHRVELERYIAREIAILVSDSHAIPPRARLPLFVVGNLSERAGRQHASLLLTVLLGALTHVALPRGLDPVTIGIWTLPAVWSAADGAELFAWLKELATTVGVTLGGDGIGPQPRYVLATVLGRSDAHERGPEPALPRGDVALLEKAAELVAACTATRLLDWVAATRRGRPHAQGLLGFGIEAVPSAAAPLDDGEIARLTEASRILWPVDAHAGDAFVARAVAGGNGRLTRLRNWERIVGIGEGGTGAEWLVQMASGLQLCNLIGAAQWRRFYQLLSSEQQRAAHTIPEAADWPDPLESTHQRRPVRPPQHAPPLL